LSAFHYVYGELMLGLAKHGQLPRSAERKQVSARFEHGDAAPFQDQPAIERSPPQHSIDVVTNELDVDAMLSGKSLLLSSVLIRLISWAICFNRLI
jgi:hypothetical protein